MGRRTRSRITYEAPEVALKEIGDALANVHLFEDKLRLAHHDLHQAVWNARTSGATWQAIAEVLGVTSQAARHRFYSPAAEPDA